MQRDALGAEKQFGRAHHLRILDAVERVAQDHVHELGDEQRRRIAEIAPHQLGIGRLQRLVAQQVVAESDQHLPVFARIGVGDGRDVGR